MTSGANSRRALGVAAIAFAAIGVIGFAAGAGRPANDPHWLGYYYFAAQDAGLAIMIALGLGVAAAMPPVFGSRPLTADWRFALMAALALFAACAAGRFLVLGDYNLTRDEQLADFDALIFASGALSTRPPDAWVGLSSAFNELFFLETRDGFAWVSAYLPVNAAMRALVGEARADLINPLLVGIGALALWRIVRLLRPDNTSLIVVAIALYALPGQTLVNGMTSYAMSGHLAFNLVWLWLFLKRKTAADLGALAIGFMATGLHQPLFHPLFTAPFLLLLVEERQWRRVALYASGYVLIGLFWLAWPSIVLGAAGAEPGPTAGYAMRVFALIAAFDPASASLMALNLVRWLTWQHAMFAPLLVLGAVAAFRRGGVDRALAISVFLHIPVLFLLLAYQGHGWGFRYMHGALGPAILLCAFGYEILERRFAQTALIVASLATALVLLPAQLTMASKHYQAYGDISRRIDQSGAAFAVVDINAAPFARDLVYNRPDLANLPVRLIAQSLKEDQLARLCQSAPDVVIVGRNEVAGIRTLFETADRPLRRAPTALIEDLRGSGCVVRALSGE
jgi:hypothetical protein